MLERVNYSSLPTDATCHFWLVLLNLDSLLDWLEDFYTASSRLSMGGCICNCDWPVLCIDIVVFFRIHLCIHTLHGQKVATFGKYTKVLIQVDFLVWFTEDEVHSVILDALISAYLAVATRWTALSTERRALMFRVQLFFGTDGFTECCRMVLHKVVCMSFADTQKNAFLRHKKCRACCISAYILDRRSLPG